MAKKVRFDVVQAWSQDGNASAPKPETHLNYFTCTLGGAARWNKEHTHPFQTVNDLIDEQAQELRQRPALNFAGGCHVEDGKEMKSDFTYRELRNYSLATAVRLRRRLQVANRVGTGTVGLLCSSSTEFILTWLGLMRLGVSVMLLAPQLDCAAIKHLCATRKVTTIFTDARNYDKVKEFKDDGLLAINLSHVLHSLKSDPAPATLPFNPRQDHIAHLFHTPGTSSDLPEPIPQSHHSAVSVLPSLPGAEVRAIFSTTPLYHDGIADCLMAWTSGATIHLFPGTLPVTAANIHRAVHQANTYLVGVCPVKYFTCMPDILQMLAAEKASRGNPHGLSGLQLLQRMELVGVGGIHIPLAVGDRLVASGVNLALRFSTPECGFLLSSHRDYARDREWLYLRADPSLQPDYYDFEAQPGDPGGAGAGAGGTATTTGGLPQLFELVVMPKWPHRGRTNRADGSLATGDLFEKHPVIANAWRFHSRAEEQITLADGERFHPAPLEAALLASEVGKRILDDVMMFGTGGASPGLLLLPMWSEAFVSDGQVVEEVWPSIERLNPALQATARVGREGLVVARRAPQAQAGGTAAAGAAGGERPRLPRNKKGVVLRAQAREMFAEEIASAYRGVGGAAGSGQLGPPEAASTYEVSFYGGVNPRFEARRSVSVPSGEGVEEMVASKRESVPNSEVMEQLARRFDETLGRHMDTTSEVPTRGGGSVSSQASVGKLEDYLP